MKLKTASSMKCARRFYCLLMVLFPTIIIGQVNNNGIQWITGLSWKQVKEKAKKENKYIFVDVLATWCTPCKMMDRDVYSDKKVGKYLNDKFVSIKVQVDTSSNDTEEIRKWYADAHAISQQYNISAYPTLLFFDPNSELVHKEFGFQNTQDFIMLAGLATDPNKQHFTVLKNYKEGKKDYSIMPGLAKKALQLGQKELAFSIAQDYLRNYLYKQKKQEQLLQSNIECIRLFVQSSKEPGFKLFYKEPEKIDALMGQKEYAQGLIDNIITKEEINPMLDELNNSPISTPDWTMVLDNIKRKYNPDYAERTVLDAQLRWYQYKNDWEHQAKYQIQKIEKYGLDTAGIAKSLVNNMIWNVFFKHNNNVEQLNKALEWMEVIIKADPYDGYNLDTYANLLYKTGYLKEAIRYETIASKLEPDNTEIKESLENMKKGEPTCLKDGAVWDAKTLPKTFEVGNVEIQNRK